MHRRPAVIPNSRHPAYEARQRLSGAWESGGGPQAVQDPGRYLSEHPGRGRTKEGIVSQGGAELAREAQRMTAKLSRAFCDCDAVQRVTIRISASVEAR